jgi:acyl-CoA synthetase (AMP-forming)/AMP-acid ligase II/acyl carrier protein
MGLIGGILTPLYVGGQSVLMSPAAFLQRPFRWLALMSQYQATISGGPNFAYELCVRRATKEHVEQLDLSNWQVAFCGAEPIRPETLQRFAETFAPAGFREEVFYPCYGLAEATLLAAGNEGPGRPIIKTIRRDALTAHRAAPADENSADPVQRLVACGQPTADHELRIVEAETGRVCGEDEIGEIWLRGPSIARGYWNRPEATAQSFGATIGSPAKNGHANGHSHGNGNGHSNGNGNGNGHSAAARPGFLRTGDLGFVSGGQLYVTGRLKDMIIVRGRNYYPQDIERTVEAAHEGLFAGGGAAFAHEIEGREEVVVVQEIDRQFREANLQSVVRRIRRVVADEHELDLYAVILIRQASLPRTTSGKVQRQLCRDQYAAGELKVLTEWVRPARTPTPAKPRDAVLPHQPEQPAPPSAEQLPAKKPSLTPEEIDRLAERIESWMTDWLVERASVPREEIERDKPFAEFGLDSLTAVELSQDLEDWLHVQLTPVVAWNYPTPAALARYLAREAGGGEAVSGGHEAAPARRGFEELLAEVEALSEAEAAKQARGR